MYKKLYVAFIKYQKWLLDLCLIHCFNQKKNPSKMHAIYIFYKETKDLNGRVVKWAMKFMSHWNDMYIYIDQDDYEITVKLFKRKTMIDIWCFLHDNICVVYYYFCCVLKESCSYTLFFKNPYARTLKNIILNCIDLVRNLTCYDFFQNVLFL